MPQSQILPEQISGKWIWLNGPEQAGGAHVFFRRNLPLYETPGLAELWVAAHAYYQVFVNGRFCASGPTPHPRAERAAYAKHVDISHLLEVGTNHIAVHVFNPHLPLAGMCQAPDGLWLQLDIDGEPTLWTDEKWLCHRAICFPDTGLRVSSVDVFCEHLDFRLYPFDWSTREKWGPTSPDGQGTVQGMDPASNLNRTAWQTPNIMYAPDFQFGALDSDNSVQRILDSNPYTAIADIGTYQQRKEALWISYGAAPGRQRAGVYAAETYVYCPPGDQQVGYCICDEPYRLYINDVLISEQAVPPPPIRCSSRRVAIEPLRPQDLVNQEFEAVLKPGWNHIVIAQETLTENSGILILWPDLPVGALAVYQKPDFNSMPGWSVTGPLRTPLSLFHPGFPFDQLTKTNFNPGETWPQDISAFYLSCVYEPSPGKPASALNLPYKMKEKDYLIFDFGQTILAYPCLKAIGNDGDIIDVICGEHYLNDEVIAYENRQRRNTSTLTFATGYPCEWISSVPKGFRYIMVVARRVKQRITLVQLGSWMSAIEPLSQGSFDSPDKTLNAIWQVGCNTLATTIQGVYIDSPTKDQTQCIPDAMIQSWAGYYAYGIADQAAQALESFAHTQLETGEFNALSPSGLFQAVPDYSLLWPVWLYRHIMYTGDTAFLKKMMPVLANLLAYYDRMAEYPDGPLGDMHDYLGTYCFLDHGVIDREGICTGLNAIYCRALFCASWLAAQAELPDQAQIYKHRVAKVSQEIHELTWVPDDGLYADGFHDGAVSPYKSWQSNVLAIYGGIAQPEQYETIWQHFFSADEPYELFSAGEANNPYFKHFLLEAAFALGKNAWAMRLIKHYWGKMVEAGATTWWELFDPDNPASKLRMCSKCHGYGVSPNVFLISELVGIRPAAPGMRMVFFNPMPLAVPWVKAGIPTPHGHINVEWQMRADGVFEAAISATYPLEVIPILNPKIAETAILSVSEKVAILAQDES